ncbi:MAG: 4-alpha-glucanotransferase [Desulfobacteraceae bacterium]|nr:MAG: 4-alpha-glucanotransferase [Desulfobacteraceae bacterium]
MNQRKCGILLHVTSLPSQFGIGDMGPAAYRFVDLLQEAKQRIWQILPLNPTDLACCSSPYHSTSSFAGNTLLISPELLAREGLLSQSDLEPAPCLHPDRVDFPSVFSYKRMLFQKAFARCRNLFDPEYGAFCEENSFWLDDFALFISLKDHHQGRPWSEWPREIRDRQPEALREAKSRFRPSIEREKFLQFVFSRQWKSLKAYCREKGVEIIGDVPIYSVHDSADVWIHPHVFNLDEEKRPLTVAGVPPDYFSKTGQLWGNPVYRWDELKRSGYDWWLRKIGHSMNLYDSVRIDHFRGLVAYWEVPFGEKNAVNGRWVKTPSAEFFEHIVSRFSPLHIIAEDLGIITPDVYEVMDRFGFPGMKVLLFAFGGDPGINPYLPHNFISNCVVYTGTHDNNTARAWFEHEASEEEVLALGRYLGKKPAPDEIHWDLIRLAMMSVSERVVIPLQDVLGLGSEARMNQPATQEGNWQWRFLPEQTAAPIFRTLMEMTETYGRAKDQERQR